MTAGQVSMIQKCTVCVKRRLNLSGIKRLEKMVISIQTKYLCKHISDALLKTNIFVSHASEWLAGLLFVHVSEIYFDFFIRRRSKCLRLLQLLMLYGSVYLIYLAKKVLCFLLRLDSGFENNYPFVTTFCSASSINTDIFIRCSRKEGEIVNGEKINFHRSSKTDNGHFSSIIFNHQATIYCRSS